VRRPTGFLALSLCGCATILGIGDVPTPTDASTSITDAALDNVAPLNDVQVGPCSADAGACDDPTVVPTGWSATIFSKTVKGCPNGFNGASLFADPVAATGACTCKVTNPVAPTCAAGSMTRKSGSSVSCANTDAPIAVTGGCDSAGGTLEPDEQLGAVPAGGSCTAQPASDDGKLTTVSAAVCIAVACPQNVCAGTAPPGYSACIQTSGDKACPTTGPFKTKHLVADSMALDCASACPGCTASATCTDQKVAFYSNLSCTQPIVVIPANGTCVNNNGGAVAFASLQYLGTVTNPQYVAAAPLPAKIASLSARTVCCAE